ncbi:MAG TPA: hypothetical protein IAB38_00430 [Candidatus Onthousia excrementipullorum]|uniref:Uncharacterized protein n=1 Tax=Candidatus Onthousia excrementipullorum TaxID=2840884 RepID=A0A9D1J2Q2_9FIRM|nr:hypothetical protein [Candidatus Onthousia excrementipullorum]
MRDAIGQVFTLQIILAFVLLINGYMAYSVNYTRAFRVKNRIVDIIEQYEGPYNDEAIAKINSYIDQMTYEVPPRLVQDFLNDYGSNANESSCQNGWCYVAHEVSIDEADGERKGRYYSVVTFVNINIPVINNIVGLGDFLRVVGETRTIYYE